MKTILRMASLLILSFAIILFLYGSIKLSRNEGNTADDMVIAEDEEMVVAMEVETPESKNANIAFSASGASLILGGILLFLSYQQPRKNR